MHLRRLRARVSLLAALLMAVSLTLSCGGSDGDGGGSTIPDLAVFDPADTPGDFAMLNGASTGVDFDIEIRVDSVPFFSGASFNVGFDPTKVTFVGFDATGSVVAGANSIFDAANAGSGEVAVVATLAGGANVGTPSDDLLITLQFRAIATTSNSPLEFLDNSSAPPTTRVVTSCPTPFTCDDIEATLSYTGGVVIATN